MAGPVPQLLVLVLELVLNSAATFFLDLMLADTPLRVGLVLTAASHAGCASAVALGS